MVDNIVIFDANVIPLRFNLDRNVEYGLPPVKLVKEDDTGRALVMHLFNNGAPYQTTKEKSTFYLRVRKPDKKVWMQECIIYNDTINIENETVVYVKLDGQALVCFGRAYCDLLEVRTDERYPNTDYAISTIPFILDIVPSPDAHYSEQLSSDDFPYLLNFISKAARAENIINGMSGEVHLISVNEEATVDFNADDDNKFHLTFNLPIQSKPSVSSGGTLVWPNVSGGSCDCELGATSSGDKLTLDITHGE